MLVEPDLHLVLDGQSGLALRPAIECEQGHDRVDHHEGEEDDRDRRTPLERDDVDDLHDAGQKYANPH